HNWLMAFHVIFVVTWFAGLFYLPRLFIYHVEADTVAVKAHFCIMERRLLGITHIGAALTLIMGLALVGWWSARSPAFLFDHGWFYVKMALVALLIGYLLMLIRMTRQLAREQLRWTS